MSSVWREEGMSFTDGLSTVSGPRRHSGDASWGCVLLVSYDHYGYDLLHSFHALGSMVAALYLFENV